MGSGESSAESQEDHVAFERAATIFLDQAALSELDAEESGNEVWKGADLRLPIYLDAKLQKQLERLALKNGKDIGEMVNQLVQKEVELIEKPQ